MNLLPFSVEFKTLTLTVFGHLCLVCLSFVMKPTFEHFLLFQLVFHPNVSSVMACFSYLLTYLPTYLPTYLLTYLLTYFTLLTYLLTLLYLLTYLLTPWNTVLLEKLIVSAASQEIPHIFGTRTFLTVLTSARHLSLS